MSADICDQCRRYQATIERLEREVAELYAALTKCTRDNLEMRKRLQSWVDDFDANTLSPGHLVNTTGDACGAGFRQHNSRTGNN